MDAFAFEFMGMVMIGLCLIVLAIPSGRRGGVLLPWPNRNRDGRWAWEGRELQLDIASVDKPTAIHGLVSSQPWQVLDEADDRVTVGTVVEKRSGYPFRLAAAIE